MRQFSTALILLAAVTLQAVPLPADASSADKINWLSYNEAQKQKDRSDRKFFVYFHADWCAYCHKLEKNTFSDSGVVDYINSHFTPVRIDSDKEKKLAARFGVQGLPDLRFLDAEGKDIARWPGYIESGPLLNLLRFIHTDSYKTMNFRKFVKQQEKN